MGSGSGQRTLTPLERGRIRQAIQGAARALRRKPPDFGGAAPVAVANTQETRSKKLSQTIDQGADAEFEVMDESEVRQLFSNYDSLNGGRPQPGEEPTAEQLSALRRVLETDAAPFTDFAVWGPYGRRQSKLLRHHAHIFVGGELVTKQLTGPSSFSVWRECWR
eukprot:5724387-Heterocapsa_arctica.AAC.1